MPVNKLQFLKTIEEYNSAVQEGEYRPAEKDGKCTMGITPPKSNWALRIEQSPFYAYPVTCGITFSFGGLHVNPLGQVLDTEEQPIEGVICSWGNDWWNFLQKLPWWIRFNVGGSIWKNSWVHRSQLY